MRPLVLFYSLDGSTCALAEQLAYELDADLGQIHCPRYDIAWGRLFWLWDLLVERAPAIVFPDIDIGADRQVVLGGPVWAGRLCGPLRTALSGRLRGCYDLMLFATYRGPGDSLIAERAIADARALFGSAFQGYATVSDAELDPQSLDATAERLARLFRRSKA